MIFLFFLSIPNSHTYITTFFRIKKNLELGLLMTIKWSLSKHLFCCQRYIMVIIFLKRRFFLDYMIIIQLLHPFIPVRKEIEYTLGWYKKSRKWATLMMKERIIIFPFLFLWTMGVKFHYFFIKYFDTNTLFS